MRSYVLLSPPRERAKKQDVQGMHDVATAAVAAAAARSRVDSPLLLLLAPIPEKNEHASNLGTNL